MNSRTRASEPRFDGRSGRMSTRFSFAVVVSTESRLRRIEFNSFRKSLRKSARPSQFSEIAGLPAGDSACVFQTPTWTR